MSLYFTEEEYEAYIKRRAQQANKNSAADDAMKAALTEYDRDTRARFTQDAQKLLHDLSAVGVTLGDGKRSGGDPGDGKPGDGKPGDAGRRRSKYGNRRTEFNGFKFDSAHEAEIYQELLLRVKAGELICVLRQVAFDLPGGIRYIADFVAIAPDMSVEGIYDAKSEATKRDKVYVIKRKLMAATYGFKIREV